MAGIGRKSEKVATTKAADRLYIVWLGMAKRVKSMGLVNLKVESLAEKDFKAPGDEMTKSKKDADWIWEFDYDSFSFEFNLVVGSKKTKLASAAMNTIADMGRRREILDAMRGPAAMITQPDIDKYFKQVEERAAKSAAVKKIDEDIQKEKDNIETNKTFVAGLAKSVEDLDRGQRQMDLLPIADKIKLGAYVEFVYGLDAGFNAYALMKKHFSKGAARPLASFPDAIVQALRKQFGADEKGEPDFAGARKIAVGVVNAKAMPAYRKDMTEASNKSMRASALKIQQLQAKRAKAMAGG
jgi:hypothetical protein